jgi:hypothetical protein
MAKETRILKVEKDGEDGLIVTFSDGTIAGYVVEELLLLRPIREAVKEPVDSNSPTTRFPNCATTGNVYFKLLGGRRLCDRPIRLVIFGDPIALNVELRTEISTHHGAHFFGRCSADWTLEIERRIIHGHASLLPLFGQR